MTAADATTAESRLRIPLRQSPCLAKVTRLGWAETIAVRAGSYILGVRASTPAGAALLRDQLDQRVVPDADADPNLSVFLAPPAAPGETQELHRIYHGHHRIVRTRDPQRIVTALDGYLDAHARVFDGGHPLVLATAVVRDGQAHLLPSGIRRQMVDHERRWVKDGFRLIDRPWVDVDLETAEVVVPEPSLVLTEEDRDRIDGLITVPSTVDPGVAPGRYPIASWSTRRGEGTPGARLLVAARSVANLTDTDAAAVLPALRDVLAAVPEFPVGMDLNAVREQLLTV